MRKLALVAARTDNAVILTDPQGRIEWVNTGCTRITGYEPAEVIGRTPGALLQGPKTDPAAAESVRERHRRGEGLHVEIINDANDGREYRIAVESQPIHDDSGRLLHFMAIEADVTERKRAEQLLNAAHRERQDIMEAVPDLHARLEQRILRLDAQRQIDPAISGSLDLRLTLGIVPDQTLAQLKVDAAAVPLTGSHDQVLTYAAGKGLRTDGIAATHRRPGQGFAGRAVLEQCPVAVPDLARSVVPFVGAGLMAGAGFLSYHVMPLVAEGRRGGALRSTNARPWTPTRSGWPSSKPWPVSPPSPWTTPPCSETSSGRTPGWSRPTTPRSRAGPAPSTSGTRGPRGTPGGSPR